MGVHAALLVRSLPPPVTGKPFTLFSIPGRLLWPEILILWLMLCSSFAITAYGDDISTNNVGRALLKFKNTLLSSTDKDEFAKVSEVFSSWNSNSESTKPCSGNYANWLGVLCSEDKVWGLQLENMSLAGDIDVDALLQLPDLRALSFMNNSLDGPLPQFKRLGNLKSLYLSHNQFSGQIPDDAFVNMPSLKKLYLSYNQFRGALPSSVGQLNKLLDLSLEGNQFVGRIPNFTKNNDLKVFNVSNNQLEGPIPATLTHFSPASFSGNKGLCGKPLDSKCKNGEGVVDSPSADASGGGAVGSGQRQSSILKAILVIVSIGLALGILILLALVLLHRRRSQTPRLGNAGSSSYDKNHHHNSVGGGNNHVAVAAVASRNHSLTNTTYKDDDDVGGDFGKSPFTQVPPAADHRTLSRSPSNSTTATTATAMTMATTTTTGVGGGAKGGAGSHSQQGRLTFIREDRHTFDLQDLLRASAEVLGSGNFGSSYKAVLMDGKAVVVKRFKQMNTVDRQEFNEHMTRLGRLIHPNLLPLVAYYYRKEEKLLVSDHVSNGSLASHLHGNRRADQPGLDWPTRLKIVRGVSKGMSYLYKELPSLVAPHGHLKSSNVLLDESFNPILMDYTLVPVMNQEHAKRIMVAYRSPEFIQHGRLTKKTDVWSLGILILELLTGKFPPPNYQLPTAKGAAATPAGGAAGDLVSWVDSIVKEAEALQLFDKELLVANKNSNCEGEMLKLFQIGMACCEEDVSKRLDLDEAVSKIQDLKESDRYADNISKNNHSFNLSLI